MQKYSIPFSHKLILIYTGKYGISTLSYQLLSSFKNCTFLGYYPPSSDVPPNFIPIQKGAYSLQDYSYSCDYIISKLGYSLVCEALSAQKPLLYFPRTHFVEQDALEKDLFQYGQGIRLHEDSINPELFYQEIGALQSPFTGAPIMSKSCEIWQWIARRLF